MSDEPEGDAPDSEEKTDHEEEVTLATGDDTTTAEHIDPTLPRKTMADFPGKTIATPRLPIYPSIPVPSLYGTTAKMSPGTASDALMQSVLRDYENSQYRTDIVHHRVVPTSSTDAPPDVKQSTSIQSTTPGDDVAASTDTQASMVTTRVLSATTIPSFVNAPKVAIPETSPSAPSSASSSTGAYKTTGTAPSPFATTLNSMTTRVYTSGLATSLASTTSGDIVGPNLERSLSIHTPTFKGATPEQLMSSYIQDLAYPSQIISCENFINWTDYVSTWSYEERQKRDEKLSITRFANLGYYKPEQDREEDINTRVYLVQGDITAIQCDCIINVTDEELSTKSLPTQATIARGGPRLRAAFKALKLSTGEARKTKAYNLPCKAVVHVAAPIAENPSMLDAALDSALTLAVKEEYRNIAIPSFAPEAYPRPSSKPSYALVPAAHVMMRKVRKWMNSNWAKVDRIMFVASCPREFNVFAELMLDYFEPLPTKPPSPPPPPPPPPEKPESAGAKKKKGKKKGKKKK